MSASIKLAETAFRRWQFPALDSGMGPATAPPIAAADGDGGPNGAAASEAPPAALPDPQALAALAAERAAEAYAEGLERGLAEGRDKGYAAGLEAAQAVEQRLAAQVRRLAAILDRFDAPIAVLQRPVEEAVAALALEIARCVIGGEVARSRDHLVRLIREAVARMPIEMGAPKILLNPADLDLVRALAPDIDSSRASFVADEAIEAGGCRVVADGDDAPVVDRRWRPRAGEGVSQVDLTLSSRWRNVILTLFDGAED